MKTITIVVFLVFLILAIDVSAIQEVYFIKDNPIQDLFCPDIGFIKDVDCDCDINVTTNCTYCDSRFLKLDASNDPITGDLEIAGDILPTTWFSRDLGSSLKYWDKVFTRLIFLSSPIGNPAILSALDLELRSGTNYDIILRVGDNAGNKKVSFQDSDGVEVAYVDSDGHVIATSYGKFNGVNVDGLEGLYYGVNTRGHYGFGGLETGGARGLNIASGHATRTDGWISMQVDGREIIWMNKSIINISTKVNIDTNSTTALNIEQAGIKNNVFVVDTINGRVGVNTIPNQNYPFQISGPTLSDSYYVGGGSLIMNTYYGTYIQTRGRGAYGFNSANEIGGARGIELSSGDGITYNDGYIRMSIDGKERLKIDNGLINATGNITGNFFYAEMHFHNDTTGNVTNITEDIWTNITAFDQEYSGQFLNGFSYSDSKLTANNNGLYKIDYSVTFSGSANNKYHTATGINGVVQFNTEAHDRISNVADVMGMSGTGFLQITANDQITLMIMNEDSSGDATILSANLNLVRIGD